MTAPAPDPALPGAAGAPSASAVIALADIRDGALEQVGGKALQLAELIHGGFRVPDGFCVTTAAYRRVADRTGVGRSLEELAATPPDDSTLARLAADIARTVRGQAVPADLAAGIASAYRQMGDAVPVAVRSSATAEDLPFASFAGQRTPTSGWSGTTPCSTR